MEPTPAQRAQLAASIIGAWFDPSEVVMPDRVKKRIEKALQLADALWAAAHEERQPKASAA